MPTKHKINENSQKSYWRVTNWETNKNLNNRLNNQIERYWNQREEIEDREVNQGSNG